MGAQIRRGVILTILLFCDTKNNIPWILNIIKGKFSMTYVYFKHIKHIKLNDKATITTAKDEVWISSWKLLFSGGRDEPSVGEVYRGKFFFWFEGMGEQVFCYWGDSLIPLVGKNLPFMAI